MVFGKRNRSPKPTPSEMSHQAMQGAIKKAEENDPLVRHKIGAKAVKSLVYDVLKKKDPRGVHLETALGILGSVAGFSCLKYAFFAQENGIAKEDPNAVVELECADGNTYFFGNLSNGPLLENQYSIWGLVGGMAQHLNSKRVPDVQEIVQHVASSAGRDTFGIPRLPEGHGLADTPQNYATAFSPVLIDLAKTYTTNPTDWPIVFGLAAQEVIQDGQTVIDPGLAAQIVMECAVPMSKIDPNPASR